jgi:hypothetical protein
MRFLLFALAIFGASHCSAAELILELHENATKQTTYHSLEPPSGKVAVAAQSGSEPTRAIAAYRIKDWKLVGLSSGGPLLNATEILSQASHDGLDFIVLRDEYNSFSNPLRLLSALAGHPTQVSKIVWVVIRNGIVIHSIEIKREPGSYSWTAGMTLSNTKQ